MIIPVILSGGSGTRLWPVSTNSAPKQFQPLTGKGSMFLQTLDRAVDRRRFAAPMIVCGPAHVAHVEADLLAAGVTDARIVVEPAARNTAPAIALAACAALAEDPDATILVMPADHVMTDVPAFLRAIEAAMPAVEAGALATFGIAPSHPETGYGYIAAGAPLPATPGIYEVRRFVEKPPRDKAEAMLAEGGHYWNAGIFLMRSDRFLAELERQQPAIAASCSAAMTKARQDGARVHPASDAFLSSPSDSIDYAVMEGAEQVVVAPVDPGWSDVGGWAALHELGEKDESGNVRIGDVIAIDAADNYLRACEGKRVAVVGVSDIIVVTHGDDILIIPRDRAQEVKAIVEYLAANPSR
ncbi:mannose-1-phosphate guanyltransferase [Sphingopyxis sp. H038]|uniref:mannose-1-phosphate guanylyltransferase/mannose-6-phosphate isomerase n=1 Tax=unclassified Sphingopyxis TaxID=2614943 RepID=UPI0007317E7C|nr:MULTISPECIES: mannose-1-phosphate guanylyltransferase/mannose-6-phosphate isomerase [unclassified Sphingopyxis]KTE01976.1 mannose-1-phosphate guanyltransferase [Sphingopyxis sp. H012]KTE09726.1 mannose-1-phosphate guanyltransferase [Sphingopyxis sp. H053]KTE15119.1 mannose-1-phosphate guanyltransferase [Sphingopyxis sp. H093]KTE29827.1 mannose-1-phosphate guanyltransferase [Sphingopyxis sp. H080]KTE32944.1 mannose-1-phosphate guanyltransferase [Sphingopyxis sp. H038]